MFCDPPWKSRPRGTALCSDAKRSNQFGISTPKPPWPNSTLANKPVPPVIYCTPSIFLGVPPGLCFRLRGAKPRRFAPAVSPGEGDIDFAEEFMAASRTRNLRRPPRAALIHDVARLVWASWKAFWRWSGFGGPDPHGVHFTLRINSAIR